MQKPSNLSEEDWNRIVTVGVFIHKEKEQGLWPLYLSTHPDDRIEFTMRGWAFYTCAIAYAKLDTSVADIQTWQDLRKLHKAILYQRAHAADAATEDAYLANNVVPSERAAIGALLYGETVGDYFEEMEKLIAC